MDLPFLFGGEGTVPEPESADGHLRKTVHIDGLTGAGANDPVKGYIPEYRRRFVNRLDIFFCFTVYVRRGNTGIIEVENDAIRHDIFHVNISAPDLFDQPSPSAGTLETKSHVGPDETAFFDEDMVDSPAHFTADDKAAVAVIDRTAGDQEVAAGFPVPASVGVFSGFDTDCVITDVKG